MDERRGSRYSGRQEKATLLIAVRGWRVLKVFSAPTLGEGAVVSDDILERLATHVNGVRVNSTRRLTRTTAGCIVIPTDEDVGAQPSEFAAVRGDSLGCFACRKGKTMTATKTRYLSAGQAGRVIGVSDETIRRLVLRGKLPALDTPIGRLFLPEDVERVRSERASAESTAVAT